jgi:hypothetical protein
MPSWAAAVGKAAAPSRWRRWWSIFSEAVFMVSLPWFECRVVDQPNVNAKASTPGPRNSISNCRSTMGFDCRISWYRRCSLTVP